ncbi:MAG: 16S rRNA (cytidine(1402)-2'-O)-methyltransferase [Azoarcus sp.]|jgi:16S rRNA (cytidine1402-2'-O)-methyltransferase|nr:16S rRNA (cytidine(1402)-2'-O)-methyltransferase [Azoarcus sp.]
MNESTASPLLGTPSLYVVATPLGNLQDFSPRARAVLAAVDVIAAEDTRHSQRLLDAFGLRTRLFAVHQHNEQQATGHILDWLAAGRHVALITDAGTPAISDPGARLVARVREAGYTVTPLPGACAAVAALSVAGIAEGGFRFVGFLPAKAAARRAALMALVDEHDALVFYEAPHRVVACVTEMAAVFGGGRKILIARELTKLHEEIATMPLAETGGWFAADANRLRGEFVLIVHGAEVSGAFDATALRTLDLLLAELPLKTAVRLSAEITGASRKGLYAHALKVANEIISAHSNFNKHDNS